MSSLRTFLALAAGERALLARAACLLAAVRVARAVLPWPLLRRLAARASHPAGRRPRPASGSTDRLCWAVDVASRYVPGATCLTRALALQIWLGRRGQAAELRFGVARGAEAPLDAHAWLESEGRILIGAAEVPRYAPLPPTGRRGV